MNETSPLVQPVLASVAQPSESIGIILVNINTQHSGGADIAEGTYVIESKGLKGQVLGAAEGDGVALGDYASVEGQHWGIARVNPGVYRVVNASTRKALQGGSEVVQELWSGCDGQVFTFWSSPVAGDENGCFRITVESGDVVTVDPVTKSVITDSDGVRTDNEGWILRRVSGPMPKPLSMVRPGVYTIRSHLHEDRLLSRKSVMAAAGDDIVLKPEPPVFLFSNGTTSTSTSLHSWEIKHVHDNYYRLESHANMLKTPVIAADASGACNLQFWEDGADNMLWEFQLEGRSQQCLLNKKYQKFLGVAPDGVSVRLLAGAARSSDRNKLWVFEFSQNQASKKRKWFLVYFFACLCICTIITTVPIAIAVPLALKS